MGLPTRPPSSFPPPSQWLGAAALLALASGIGWLLDEEVSLVSQSMLFVLAVVIAAYKFDIRVSIGTAVASVMVLNFLFVPPRWTLAVDSHDHLIALLLMLLVAFATNHLARDLRRETHAARLSEQRARQLQQMAVALSSAADETAIDSVGRQALADAFGTDVMLRLGPAIDENDPSLSPAVRDGLARCMKERAVLGPGTGRWPGLDAWFVPLLAADDALGAIRVAPAVAADEDGREHAGAIAALLAQALQRLHLQASTLEARDQAKRQQMQTTFLAGVAHDLRTPLAAIIGAASSLQTQSERLGDDEKKRLLQSVLGEARYLTRMADNTLQLTRLQAPDAPLPRGWESVEEIVGAALARSRQSDPQRRITTTVAPDLPLIKADPILLGQLIGNLLDNALKYSNGAIVLNATVEAKSLRLEVEDHGPRIPAAEQERVFLPHIRGDNAGAHGAGLGLAVCMAIARAHDGRLVLEESASGGNRFSLLLPLQEAP